MTTPDISTSWHSYPSLFAIGILEGEGAFWATSREGRGTLATQIKVSITDEDTAQRLQAVIGGKLYGPYREVKRPHCKPYWEVRVVKCHEVSALIDKIYPHMGIRRKQQLDKQREALFSPGRRWYKEIA